MSESIKAPTNPKTITWKAEVEFQGTVEDFNKFTSAFPASGLKISFGGIDLGKLDPRRFGYIASPALEIAGENLANETHVTRIKAGPINGGIRTPHFHIGNEIALVNRTQFKNILGEVARNIFEQRALQKDDYFEVIAPLVKSDF